MSQVLKTYVNMLSRYGLPMGAILGKVACEVRRTRCGLDAEDRELLKNLLAPGLPDTCLDKVLDAMGEAFSAVVPDLPDISAAKTQANTEADDRRKRQEAADRARRWAPPPPPPPPPPGQKQRHQKEDQEFWNAFFGDRPRRHDFKTAPPGGAPSHILPAMSRLGLKWPFSDADLKAAFRTAAKKAHPDQGGSAEQFEQLQKDRDQLEHHVSK